MIKTIVPGFYAGVLTVPPSKSDAQRAILCASLCHGRSVLNHVGKSSDVQGMLKAVEKMGSEVIITAEHIVLIDGQSKDRSTDPFSVGESGLAFRLLCAVLALRMEEVTITGEGTLLTRKMEFLSRFFPVMGVQVGLNDHQFPPVTIKGPLIPGSYLLDGQESSQYISGLLMAFPLLKKSSELLVKNMVSSPYIQMTLNTLRTFGIEIDFDGKERFQITGNQVYMPTQYKVEGDWSAASYWIVAAALGAKLCIKGLSAESLQADKVLLGFLAGGNCTFSWDDNGLHMDGSLRTSLSVNATDCPDLFPALVTYAALTQGISQITGVNRLHGKESNRGETLKMEFKKLGIHIELLGDDMFIHGSPTLEGGVKLDSHGDHRIAMCLAIAGLFCKKNIQINGAEAVSKSYPEFWQHIEEITC
jgi:3-phosphoshikimate 1-carboxyvinyltransferase